MSKPVMNVALIGLGMVAETHLRALGDLRDGLKLRGIYARSSSSMENFARKAEKLLGDQPLCYTSIDEIAKDDAIDFVIILTPPNARMDYVETLSAAGKPILMEKPIERDSKAAQHIVDLCEERGVTLGIVFQHRMRAASIALQEMIASDQFGAMGLVEASVPWWREQAYYDEPGRGTYARDGGGVLISQAIHTLDLMLSLTGPVSEVQAMAATTRFHKMEAEDFVSAGLQFSNGAVGTLVASTASYPGGAESLVLHFDKAVAELKSGVLSIAWRDGSNETIGAQATTGGGADPMAFTHDWHRDIISDFARAISDKRAPLVSGREALNAHRLIDGLLASSKAKKAISITRTGAE